MQYPKYLGEQIERKKSKSKKCSFEMKAVVLGNIWSQNNSSPLAKGGEGSSGVSLSRSAQLTPLLLPLK